MSSTTRTNWHKCFADYDLRGFDALIANRQRPRFRKELLMQLPDLRIIAQTGSLAYRTWLAATSERAIVVARASGGFCDGAVELATGLTSGIDAPDPGARHCMNPRRARAVD
jgi:phosphoglycerate dehydrogenase-like enzyme